MIRSPLAIYRESFAGLPRAAWLLSVVVLVNRAGTMVLPFLALWLTEKRGFTAAESGLALSFYGAGAMAGALGGGWATDRFGWFPVHLGSFFVAGSLFLVLGTLEGRFEIAAALFVLATFAEAVRPANGVALSEMTGDEERVRAFALRRQAINMGMTIGPAAGGLLATVDYSWLFRVDGLTCIAAGFVLWAIRGRLAPQEQNVGAGAAVENTTAVPSRPTGPPQSPWSDGPFLVFSFLGTLLVILFFQLLATYPLTLRSHYELSEPLIGAVFAFNTVLILIFEMPLVAALRRRDPVRIVAIGAVLVGLGFGVLPFGRDLGLGYSWVIATLVVWTFGEMLFSPFGEGWAATRASAGNRRRGAYLGLYTLTYSIGLVVAPGLGSWVYEHWGTYAVWVGCAALGSALGLGFLVLARRLESTSSGAAPLGQP